MAQRIDRKLLESKLYMNFDVVEMPIKRFSAVELADPVRMKELLDAYAPLIKAKDLQASAAYFGNWCGGLAVSLQATISLWNSSFDLSPERMTIALYPDGDYYRFAFELAEWCETAGPETEADRAEWVCGELTALYRDTLRPIFEAASSVSGLPIGHMWGLIPSKMNYYVRLLTEQPLPGSDPERLLADFTLLKSGLDTMDVFGRTKNPFDVKLRKIESLMDPNQQMLMKNVCCLYYKTEGGNYCYTCPRMKEEERSERRARARAEQAVSQ